MEGINPMDIEYIYEENPLVSRNEAMREVEKHGISIEEFFEELGDCVNYSSLAVLQWLGY